MGQHVVVNFAIKTVIIKIINRKSPHLLISWHGLSVAIVEEKSDILLVFPVPNETNLITKNVFQWVIKPNTVIVSDEGGAFTKMEQVNHPVTNEPMNWKHEKVCHNGQIGDKGMFYCFLFLFFLFCFILHFCCFR